jgi:hypothetical protein
MMFRPEVPMTSRKAVLKKMGELVIESPPLRTSGGPSRYCADPNGRDILATPEEIAAARCGDCKKLTTLAARRAIDAGAKRVDLAMTVTDEPDEHVFMIVWWKDDEGEFRDPAREAGMPCRVIDLFVPVTIWPLSEFGKSTPPSAGAVQQILEETSMHQDEAALYEAYRNASGGNAGGSDEMALALHDAYEIPFTTAHREPFFPEANRAQGPADTLANLGLIDAWSQNAQTQWNIDANRAQGPSRDDLVAKSAVFPTGASALPKSTAPTPTSMAMPPPPAMTPKPMPKGDLTPSSAPTPKPLGPPSPTAMPSSPAAPKSMPGPPAHVSPAALALHQSLDGEPTHGEPTHGEPTHGELTPTPTHGQSAGHPAYSQPSPVTGQPGHVGSQPGGWQPKQPPVEGVTRNEGREEWRGGAWVPTQPGHWQEGEIHTAPDGTQLIYRKGDWVRGDETSQVVVFSDGSFRTYTLDGRWHEGHPGEVYPEGPIFYDVATMPLGTRFSFFVSGVSAYRLDNITGKLVYLGQYMPNHTVLVGSVLYHPRPDGTLLWIGPAAYGVNPQADVNLITYQSVTPVRREIGREVILPHVGEDLEVFHERREERFY